MVSTKQRDHEPDLPKQPKSSLNGMKVSIVTVCFNSADTIEDTIRSVREQEYEHIEHVIVDGGSTDGTLDIVKKYNGRIKKFISEPDGGIYDAMNKGLRLAQGEVVAFLNADDVYASPTVISDVVAATARRSGRRRLWRSGLRGAQERQSDRSLLAGGRVSAEGVSQRVGAAAPDLLLPDGLVP